jgi:hypothetical protein
MLNKKILAVLIVSFISNFVYSQKTFPSFEDHPEWNVQRSIEPFLPGPVFVMSYHLEKDTTINQKTYYPVSRTGNQQPHLIYERIGFIRSDAKKVFFKKSAEGKEYLLYDFGLHVDDKVYCPYYELDSAQYHVLAIDSLELNGVKHLRLKVRPEDYYIDVPFVMEWIEGIGNLENPFYQEVFGRSGLSDEVRCVSTDTGFLYQNPNYDDCTTVLRKTDFIVNEGYVWSGMNIYKDQSGKDSVSSYHIRFDGDTILNDRTYTKIWQSNDSLGVSWKLTGLIREVERRVYYHTLNDDGFYDMLLYDFSVHTGNSLLLSSIESPGFFERMSITNVDSVEVNGGKRLRIELSASGKYVDTWFEKIGSLQGILSRCYKGIDAQKILLCVQVNGKTIYSNQTYPNCFYSQNSLTNNEQVSLQNSIEIFPNPASDKLFVDIRNDRRLKLQIRICNLNGGIIYNHVVSEYHHTIDISMIPPGLYLIQVMTEDSIMNKKVIIR